MVSRLDAGEGIFANKILLKEFLFVLHHGLHAGGGKHERYIKTLE